MLDIGQDLAIGYSHHDANTVTLYLEESSSFRVTEPDAALALSNADAWTVNGGAPAGGAKDVTVSAPRGGVNNDDGV